MSPGFFGRWFGRLFGSGGARIEATAGAVVLRDNWGVVNTGVIHGDVVVCNGAEYPLSLAIPRVDDPEPNVSGLLGWRSRIPATL
ncbi:MAG: hypothetical protein HY778_12405 [Betaproteobacteria bacterium]|nr:hypothetical protein [Betaproteobacteria bacterium]